MNIPLISTAEKLLDSFSTAMLFIDSAFDTLHINAASESMLGISRNKAIGRNVFEAFPCCEKIRSQLELAMANQLVYAERDLEVQLDAEHKITLDCSITPMQHDVMGGRHLVVELNQVDRRLRISREDHLLSQGEGTRGLLRGVAHEIKNPLGGIRGAAQLLAGELADNQYKEYTDVITHEVDRLQNLVDRMLGPRQLPQLKLLNIHEILEKVRRLIEAEAPSQLNIQCDYDPSLPDILADSDMLQQAFLNLASNAMQAVNKQSQPEIIFRTRSERQFTIGQHTHRLILKIDIIDNGEGIPDEMHETIFLPMVTGKPEGTGLGLPIAQSLIQRHGGLIEFSSQPDETCFSVYLPVESNHAS